MPSEINNRENSESPNAEGRNSLPKILSKECVFTEESSAHLSIYAECVDFRGNSGNTAPTLIHVVQTAQGAAGAVVVAHYEDKILLARHWRTALDAVAWEFPRGMGRPGETPEETAEREFKEETGLSAESARLLQVIHADSGVLADCIHVVDVQVAETPPRKSDGELLSVSWLPVEALDAMIVRGEIEDGITLAAWAIWERRNRSPFDC